MEELLNFQSNSFFMFLILIFEVILIETIIRLFIYQDYSRLNQLKQTIQQKRTFISSQVIKSLIAYMIICISYLISNQNNTILIYFIVLNIVIAAIIYFSIDVRKIKSTKQIGITRLLVFSGDKKAGIKLRAFQFMKVIYFLIWVISTIGKI